MKKNILMILSLFCVLNLCVNLSFAANRYGERCNKCIEKILIKEVNRCEPQIKCKAGTFGCQCVVPPLKRGGICDKVKSCIKIKNTQKICDPTSTVQCNKGTVGCICYKPGPL